MSDEQPRLGGVFPIEGFHREGDYLGVMVVIDNSGYYKFSAGDEVTIELPDGEDDLVAEVATVHLEHGLTLWLETGRDPEGVHWV